jgi:multiple sugar transport system ATP-binding protein
MTCNLSNLEIMGRDASVVATHPASCNPTVRSIIDGDCKIDAASATVRYNLKPHKVFLFSKQNEKRLNVTAQGNEDFLTAALKLKYSKF